MSRLPSGKFVDLVLAGKVPMREIDEYVERWHHQKPSESLHEYLGMTWDEYAKWVEDPSSLEDIVTARKLGKPFTSRPLGRSRRGVS